jgi:hypothetical protein
MFHLPHIEGKGWLAAGGFGLIMITEATMRAVTHDPTITAPRSWWLITGYCVAAVYCMIVYLIVRRRDSRRQTGPIVRSHSLMCIPLEYWSLFYLFLGVLRVYSTK